MQKSEMPERTCASCRKKGEKEEFIRFVELDGLPVPDIKNRLPGRGFNICPSKRCIKGFVKKHFKGKINPDTVIDTTITQLKKYLLSLISIAHKSRETVIGQDNVKNLKNQSGVLILAHDLSDKTVKSLETKIQKSFKAPFSKEELGNAIKKNAQVGVIYIKPSGIGNKIENIVKKLQRIEN